MIGVIENQGLKQWLFRYRLIFGCFVWY